MPSTRFAIIGCGHAAVPVCAAIAASPLTALATVYDHNPALAADLAAQDAVTAAPTLDAVLSSPDVDAVYIAVPHDKLAPSMSRLIHESHLREGVALAIESKLPREVVQGIREHHGQSVLTQYWHKARLKDPDARSDDYCYPGPRPSTVESALVLLANEVESSARSLEDPTPSRVKGVVHRVVQDNLENGNLDDSGLTLSDLAKVREVFTTLLSGAFHGRQARENPKRGDDSKTTRTDPAPLPRHRG